MPVIFGCFAEISSSRLEKRFSILEGGINNAQRLRLTFIHWNFTLIVEEARMR